MNHHSCGLRWPAHILAAGLALLVLRSTLSAQEDLAGLEEQAMRAAVARVAPSVLRIETLGGLEKVQGKLVGTGPTTGVVVSEDGFILSSAFNFVRQPSSILVTLPSGKRTSATIVARDKSRMLVLLKVETDAPLAVPTLVPREEITVGQWSIAVGRTYAGQFPNVSVGIISARSRIWGIAVQTDAKVSPGNYGGPLIDIRGRVIGILVPLSPQRRSELAGAEWYDSGIGFAVPLADVMPRLDTLKKGTDLWPGILGVSLKGSDMYSLPATIAACPAKSPAREAGLKVGDTIIEVNGVAIERHAQLRHVLGPLLAGDKVRVIAVRGTDRKRIEVTAELVAQLEPYVRPEIGLLPMRVPAPTGAEKGVQTGVVIRYVFPGSAAARSGLNAGDRIIGIGPRDVPTADALRDVTTGLDPGETISVRFVRGGSTKAIDLKLGRQGTSIPDKLPAAHGPVPPANEDLPAVGIVDIQIPEVANKCFAYVPTTYNPRNTYGLLVWLHAPGQFDQEAVIDRWKAICEARDMILLAPQSADPKRWTSTEIEFIRKTMDDVIGHYRVDPSRVVLHGYLAGGAMAYHVALGNREIVRAVAPINAPLPLRAGTPATDPVQPLAIFSVSSEQSRGAQAIKVGEERLKRLAFPVIARTLSGPERYLNEQELAEFVRWIDTLDRI